MRRSHSPILTTFNAKMQVAFENFRSLLFSFFSFYYFAVNKPVLQTWRISATKINTYQNSLIHSSADWTSASVYRIDELPKPICISNQWVNLTAHNNAIFQNAYKKCYISQLSEQVNLARNYRHSSNTLLHFITSTYYKFMLIHYTGDFHVSVEIQPNNPLQLFVLMCCSYHDFTKHLLSVLYIVLKL